MFAMLQCIAHGHEIVGLANLIPPPDSSEELDSFMFQTVGFNCIQQLALCLDLPLVQKTLDGSSIMTSSKYEVQEDDEVEDLFKLLQTCKSQFCGLGAVAFGGILSNYQRVRVEHVCHRLGLTALAYLWKRPQLELVEEMIECGLKAILIKVATLGLDGTHLGLTLDKALPALQHLHQSIGINVAGEGGEYETLTLDSPMHKKELVVEETVQIRTSDDDSCGALFIHVKSCCSKEKAILGTHLQLPLHVREILLSKLPVQTLSESEHWLARSVDSGPQGAQMISSNSKEPQTSLQNHSQHRNPLGWTPGPSRRRKRGPFTVLNGLTPTNASITTLHLQFHDILTFLTADFPIDTIIMTRIYLSKIEDFGELNTVYASFFGSNHPAVRLCVALLPPTCWIMMDAIMMDTADFCIKSVDRLHVQSISTWAPANIGPYSQAIHVTLNSHQELQGGTTDGLDESEESVEGRIWIAGQIGLIPWTMKLPTGENDVENAMLEGKYCLRHVQAIGTAMLTHDSTTVPTVLQLCASVSSGGTTDSRMSWKVGYVPWMESCFASIGVCYHTLARSTLTLAKSQWQQEFSPRDDCDVATGGDSSDCDYVASASSKSKKITNYYIPPTLFLKVKELPRKAHLEWEVQLFTRSKFNAISSPSFVHMDSTCGGGVRECVLSVEIISGKPRRIVAISCLDEGDFDEWKRKVEESDATDIRYFSTCGESMCCPVEEIEVDGGACLSCAILSWYN